MTLGTFLVVLQMRDADGAAGRDDRLACRPVAHPAAASRGDGDVHVQPRRHPAAARLLAEILRVQRRGAGGPHLARRGRHRDLGDRRLLLSARSSRSCISTIRRRPIERDRVSRVEGALIAAVGRCSCRRSAISLIGAARRASRRTPQARFCSDPHRRRDRFDQRRCWPRWPARRGRRPLAARRAADRRARAAGPGLAVAATAISMRARWSGSPRRSARRRRWRWWRRWRLHEVAAGLRRRACGRASNGRTTCWSTAPSSPASCSNGSGDAVVVGFGVNLAAIRSASIGPRPALPP